MKNVAVLTEDGAFALLFRPHPGGFDSSRVPTPGNLPSKAKKLLIPGDQPGRGGGAGRRWNWLMHYRTCLRRFTALPHWLESTQHQNLFFLNKVIAFDTFVVEKGYTLDSSSFHFAILTIYIITRTHSQILSGHLALPPLPEPCVTMQEPCTRLPDVISVTLSIREYMYMRRSLGSLFRKPRKWNVSR